MAKKVILGTLLFGLIGILLAGAVIRTLDKTGNIAEAQGNGYGHGAGRGADTMSTTSDCCDDEAGEAIPAGNGRGQSGGGGYGRTAEAAGVPAAEAIAPEEWVTIEGTVVQEPAAGVDLIVETAEGELVVVGTGPGYLETQGFALEAGEQVRVEGFWEDGEFKAGEITRLRDGATVQIRDMYGRPAWSGGYGRGAGSASASEQAAAGVAGNGQAAAGGGQGGYGGEGNSAAPGDTTGTGQAQVDEWVTLEGTAVAVSTNEMTFQADGGESLLVDGRAWRFIQEQGFVITTGDRLRLTGFYENGDLEVGIIDDLTTGQSVSIRDENGRPLWAGRGRRGG
ncbi:MAG: hypothetical protein JXA93_09045 [Anaerolineae bacterium]|nr:hypothetical protein [Anaerolineae bacterium]